MQKFSKNPDWKSTLFSFGAIHALRLALPLLALPWLGRVLGQEAFGLLMYMCLFPPILALIIEWGFPFTSVRSAAKLRSEPEQLGKLLRGVCLAKFLLMAGFLLLSLPTLPFLPHVSVYPLSFCMAICAGSARAFTPLWFYQGINKHLKSLVLWDTGSSISILILSILFIHSPENWHLYLVFYALCKGLAHCHLTLKVLHKYPGTWNLPYAIKLIKNGATLFTGLFIGDLYHYGFQLICSFFLDASALGILIALSKILRALTSLIVPFTQTIFPEICLSGTVCPEKSRKILRLSLALSFIAMTLICLLCYPLSPLILKIALGSSFSQYADILRNLMLAAPLASVNSVLALQILIPYGYDLPQTLAKGAMGIIGMPLAAFLSSHFELYGASFLPFCAELMLCFFLASLTIKLCPQTLFIKQTN